MHLRALLRRARPQPRQRIGRATPRVLERAVAGAVLKARRVEPVVQSADVRRARARAATHRRVLDALPAVVGGERARAVHRRVHQRVVVLAAAHLEPTIAHRALDEQAGRLDGERLQEEHAAQRSCARRRSAARQLEVADAGEDDAALHDVVGDEGVERARGGRAEEGGAVGGGQAALHEGVRRLTPREGAPMVQEWRWRRGMLSLDARVSQHRVRDRAAVPERAHAHSIRYRGQLQINCKCAATDSSRHRQCLRWHESA